MSDFIEALYGSGVQATQEAPTKEGETQEAATTDESSVDAAQEATPEAADKPVEGSDEPNKPSKDDAPSFDEAKYLEELTGGQAKSKEEFAAILERAKSADEVATLREQLQTAYPNEFAKSIAEMVRNNANPSQLKTFIDLSLTDDLSKLDDYELLEKAAYLKESDVLTAEDAKLLISSKYPKSAEELADEKGLTEEEAEKQFRLLDIQRRKEVKEAKEFLSGFKKDVYENVVQGGDSGKTKQFEQAWQPALPAIGKQLLQDAAKIQIADEKAGIDTAFEIKMPEDFVQKALPTIPAWAASQGLEVNQENSEAIVSEVKKAYIAQNYQTIIESAIRDTWSKATKKMEEEYSNPNKPNKPVGQGQQQKESSWMDAFYR